MLIKILNIEYIPLRCLLAKRFRFGASKHYSSKGQFRYYGGIPERNYGTTAHVLLIIQHYDQFT